MITANASLTESQQARRGRMLSATEELAEKLHIEPFLKRLPAELSGGQQQRVALARALAVLQGRLITVGRELTKQFEEIATLPAQDFAGWLEAGAQRTRGEFALVLHASAPHEGPDDSLRVLQLLLAELPLKTAVKLAADITGAARNALYDIALRLKTQ